MSNQPRNILIITVDQMRYPRLKDAGGMAAELKDVLALQPLAEPELVAALRREASRRGLALPDELVQHLLTRFARDLASLMRMLERLDRYAMARARRPTVPLLRAMLADEDGAW